MKRLLTLGLVLLTLALASNACGGSAPTTAEAPASVPAAISTSAALPQPTPPVTEAPLETTGDQENQAPPELPSGADQPYVVDELYFGVPAGNGAYPSLIAIDGANRMGYTLNRGASRQGNTLSAFNLDTRQITGLANFENPGPFGAPDPLALILDPYQPRVYALVGDRYAETPVSNLIIIDTDTLTIVEVLPGVEAVAVGPQRLFLANDTRLWTVDAQKLTTIAENELPPRKYNSPMALNPRLGRVYLGRGNPSDREPAGWALEVFDMADLAPIGTYPTPGEFEDLAVAVDTGYVYLVESDTGQAALRVLDADGLPLSDRPPLPLAGDYYDFPTAIAGDVLFVSDGVYDAYHVRRFRLPDLEPLPSVPLTSSIKDLAADPASGSLFTLAYNFSGPIDIIPPPAADASQEQETTAAGQADIDGAPANRIYSAINLRDGLVDAAGGRLFLLDEAGQLRVLRLDTLTEELLLETGYSAVDDFSTGAGELSLDASRQRLYIGGCPARTVDTQTWQVTVYADVCGQLTPDPTGDRVYLTPPCSCRLTQCNTLLMSADEMTGAQTIYAPMDPFTAPCPVRTLLDPRQQLLYVKIYNGTPGSNSGDFFSVFDVAAEPQAVYTNTAISYGQPALDSEQGRAFFSRYRMDTNWLQRFGQSDASFEQTMDLAGAGGQLTYDQTHDRLYAAGQDRLSVYDGELTLLAEMSLPGGYTTIAADEAGQRLFLRGDNGQLLVVSTSGGQLQAPPLPSKTDSNAISPQQLQVASDGAMFRLLQGWLYRSDDGGEVWRHLGRGLPARQWDALALSPNYPRDGTLFVSRRYFGSDGGVYRSTDGGETWQPATRGLTDLNVGQIVFSPAFEADNTLFAVAPNTGIFRSTDGGDSWRLLVDGQHPPADQDQWTTTMDGLALSPAFAEDNMMFVTWGNLRRSNDGGLTWRDMGAPGGMAAFSPNFASDGLVLADGSWRTSDGGLIWYPSAAGLETADYGIRQILFSGDFTADRTVYILLDHGNDKPVTLQRSVDAGQTWQSLNAGALQDGQAGRPQDFELAAAAILPDQRLYLSSLTGQGLVLSAGELDWNAGDVAARQTSAEELQEVQSLVADADGVLFAAHSMNGIFRSSDGGRSWETLSFPVRGGWGDVTRLAAAHDGALFASVDGAIVRSRDHGDSWDFLPNMPAGFQPTAIAVSPNFGSDGVLIAGGSYTTRQIIRSSDEGDTWQIVFDAGSNEEAAEISTVAISPNFAEDGLMYAWLLHAGLLVSEDGGLTWTQRAGDQQDAYGESLLVSPDGRRLYLGALYGHVLVSEDLGRTWIDLGQHVPDERVWSKVLLFDAAGALYLGSDVGVYRSQDGGQSWNRASFGLPLDPMTNMPLPVTAMTVHGDSLYAALYPAGIYVSDDQAQTWRSAQTGQPASPTQSDRAEDTAAPEITPTLPAASQQPVDCPFQPGFFADVWAPLAGELGCPLASYEVPFATQTFESGRMFWRDSLTKDSAIGLIYVLPTDQPYSQHTDTWQEPMPAYTCPQSAPSQTPPTPQRGFGKVWCEVEQVRQQLGAATDEEKMVDVTLQVFENGQLFQTSAGELFLLEAQTSRWQQLR